MASSFLTTLLALWGAMLIVHGSRADAWVPAIYVFGDSTADVGNNNFLPDTTAKANFPPNGVDYPHNRSTGRFSNGYNGIDFVAMNMGFSRSPPPFRSLNPKFLHHQIHSGRTGASFASGGSGILDSTGTTISMTQQVHDFKSLRSLIINRVGANATSKLLSKSIFLISSGGNDLFALATQYPNANETQIQHFMATMISNYESHLTELYNLGARKFAVINAPLIGCCPYSRTLHTSGLCMDGLNDLADSFNDAAHILFQSLSSKVVGMKYSIGNSYAIVENIIANPEAVGFKEVKSACCGAGKLGAQQGCGPNATYCEDRHHHLFWDRLHPTHATSKLAAWAFYGGSTQYAIPINFKQLIEA